MERETIIKLLEKIESGTATSADLVHYNALYMHFQKDQDWNDEVMGDKEEIGKLMFDKVNQTIAKPVHKTNFYSIYKYAAAAVVVIALSVGLYNILQSPNKEKANRISRAANDLPPGGSKATLTLANGSQISLTDAANGDLVKQSGIAITKTANGQLVYKILGGKPAANSPLQYNTISTPKGGEYQVLLPDGTKVWLNAASSLKFPTAFSGVTRKVELTGEAYFEAAHNKQKPFIVTANGTEVLVLGTHFNIMAYANERKVKTTLLEGAVKLINGKSKAMLKPGQQGSVTDSDANFKVEDVDVAAAVAWKNGMFFLEDENLESIMRKISRWYDIEVVYKDADKDLQFGGTISRYKTVSEVLDKLELAGGVHFKIEGRKIIVMK